MTRFASSIQPLAVHAIGMRYIIGKIFSILLPNVENADFFVDSEEVFYENVMWRFAELDETQTDLEMCRKAFVEVAWRDMSNYCNLLRKACENLGFGKIAHRYLFTCRILDTLIGWDRAKLAELKAVVDSGDTDFGRLMMRISEVIDGRKNVYENFDDAAKKKATEDVRNISRRAETLAAIGGNEPQKQLECKEVKLLEGQEKVVGKVEEAKEEIKDEIRALSEQVKELAEHSKTTRKGGVKRRHSSTLRELCKSCWSAALRDVGLKYSLNTRITYEAAFGRFRRELTAAGIDSATQFRRIIHSAQSLECHERRKRLEANANRYHISSHIKTANYPRRVMKLPISHLPLSTQK